MSSPLASVTTKAKENCPGLEQTAPAAEEANIGMTGPLASKIPGVPLNPATGSNDVHSAAEPYYLPTTGLPPLGEPHINKVTAHSTAHSPGPSHPHQDHQQQQQQQPEDAPATTGGKTCSFSGKLKGYGEKAKRAKEHAKC